MSTTTIPANSADTRVQRTARRDTLVLGGATVTSGLLAGVYYAFACAVMPGLQDTTDQSFVDTMQHINTAIENPAFFATFLGAPALTVWSFVTARRRGPADAVKWVAAAAGLNALALVTTMAFNVPLNDALEHAGSPHAIDAAGQLHQARADFETPWTAWNIVRTVATTAALGCLTRAAFLRRAR